ncbi:hypothetical protein SAMN05216356_10813 [Oribacterium sp. WCC10]|nr:hypothetical protein SAMN05216356_10813 [Oribacterium sp. WCC10]
MHTRRVQGKYLLFLTGLCDNINYSTIFEAFSQKIILQENTQKPKQKIGEEL